MQTIDYNELANISYMTKGSFARIYECEYNGKKYILKEYKDDDYLKNKKKKLNMLSKNVKHEQLILPIYFVNQNKNTNMLLMNYSPLNPLYLFKESSINKKIKMLKQAKEVIKIMHDEKIIHSDLHSGNILVDDKSFDINIIDFEGSSYKGSNILLKDTNEIAREFLKKYGTSEELDTFIFNITTFDLLNATGFYSVRGEINKKNYGVLNNNKDAIKICNTFFLEDDVPNKDYLIDTIDESILKRLLRR